MHVATQQVYGSSALVKKQVDVLPTATPARPTLATVTSSQRFVKTFYDDGLYLTQPLTQSTTPDQVFHVA
jgi:hypothetical protein